jgi:flagellar FliL protein
MATSPKSAPKLVSKEAAPESAEGATPVIKKKSRKKTILISAIASIILGAASGAAYFFMGSEAAPEDANAEPGQEAKPAVKAEPAKPPRFLVMEPFTVNLQRDAAIDQFLQISFSLQLEDEKQEELVKLYMPQARSRLLLLLSGKKASEISSVEGKKQLAKEILDQLRIPFSSQVRPLGVNEVFFTSFVIQ